MKRAFGFWIGGKEFKVDEAVAAASLIPTSITRDGERKGPHPRHGTYVGSWLHYSLGEGREVPFDEQQRIAIAFMRQHREQLRTLSTWPGVDRASLGLHYRRRVESNVVMFSLELSASFMRHLLDCGFGVSEYVELERFDPDEA